MIFDPPVEVGSVNVNGTPCSYYRDVALMYEVPDCLFAAPDVLCCLLSRQQPRKRLVLSLRARGLVESGYHPPHKFCRECRYNFGLGHVCHA